MFKLMNIRILSITIIVFLLAGCSSSLKRGNANLEKGLYGSAISEYKKGLQKTPNDMMLLLRLSYAQHLLAKKQFEKVSRNIDTIEDIKLITDKQKIVNDILGVHQSAIKNFEKGNKYLDGRKWSGMPDDHNIENLEKFNNLIIGATQKLTQKKEQSREIIQDFEEKALSEQEMDNWGAAKSLFKNGLKYQSDSEKLRKQLKIAQIMKEGITHFEQRKFDDAKVKFKTVYEFDPNNQYAHKWIKKCDGAKIDDLFSKANAEKSAGNLAAAIILFKECMEINPDYMNLNVILNNTIRQYAQLHHDKAINYENKSLIHHAYMEYKNVIDYDGRKFYPADYTKMEALKSKIKKESTFRIAIVDQLGFGGSQITRNVSQGVVSKLFDSAPRKDEYIQILTREQLSRILNEQALSLSGVIDPNSIINVGGVKGVSYFVTIEVTYFDGDEYNSVVDSGEKKYVAYQKEVPNPDYVPPKDRKNSDTLFGAIEALAQELTPKYKKEDVYDFCRYEKIKYEANAKIDISVSIFSAETGEILLSEFLPMEKQDTDYEVRILSGDAKKAGVERDTKNIKTKREMMQNVKDEGIQKTAQIIINKFQNIPGIYKQRGDAFLNLGDKNAAIENYVKAIVMKKNESAASYIIDKVNNLLKN